MSSYVCPRCGDKGSVLLKANQLCQSCMSRWAWGGGADNQVVTITPEAVAAHDAKPVAKATRTSPLIRVLPVVSLVLSAAVVGLLIYFFKKDPAGMTGQQIMNRFANIAITAVILSGLGVVLGAERFLSGEKEELRSTGFGSRPRCCCRHSRDGSFWNGGFLLVQNRTSNVVVIATGRQ